MWSGELTNTFPFPESSTESEKMEEEATPSKKKRLPRIGEWFYDIQEYKAWAIRVDSLTGYRDILVSFVKCTCFFCPPLYGDKWSEAGKMSVPVGAFYTRLFPYNPEEFKHLKKGDALVDIMLNSDEEENTQ
jgi:hypothetical protein